MPANRKTKATSSTPAKLAKEDLTYLAGMYEATIGLRGVGTVNAVAISNTEDWPAAMAKKYGGEAREFVSSRGKKFWGWFVPLEDRLRLLDALTSAKPSPLLALPADEASKLHDRLEKAVNSENIGWEE